MPRITWSVSSGSPGEAFEDLAVALDARLQALSEVGIGPASLDVGGDRPLDLLVVADLLADLLAA